MSMGRMGVPRNGMALGALLGGGPADGGVGPGMGGGSAGIPDLEQSQGMDPAMAQAIAAGALMGQPPDGICPCCGYPMAQDGSCPLCGMGAPTSGPGAMDPQALSALLGGGGMGGAPPPGIGGMGGMPMDGAIPPPGDIDTSGAQGDEANLQQLVAILSLLKQQGGSPGGMPPGMMPPGASPPGGPPPSGAGPGGGNPLGRAMGRGV